MKGNKSGTLAFKLIIRFSFQAHLNQCTNSHIFAYSSEHFAAMILGYHTEITIVISR